MLEVRTFDTTSLGDRSYLVDDGEVAVVIDPQRDIDRFLQAAQQRGVRITHVLETHVHNDYVSGGLELCRRTGATYVLAADEQLAFDHHGVRDGELVESGDITLRVLHTPGHTPHHVSYELRDGDRTVGVFTGGSLLYGAVGRPDLISPAMTDELAHAQYRSANRIAAELPAETPIHPTHGFGSHCASVTEDILRDGTIADEQQRNPVLTLSEDDFIEELLSGLHPWPAYYAHMGPANAKGPDPLDLAPPRALDLADLRRHLDDGHWVVDLRSRRAYAKRHVHGTINVELRDDLPTYLGWVFPWDSPLVLLADNAEDIAEAQVMLARIGIDHPSGAATGGPDDWTDHDDALTAFTVVDWNDLAEREAAGDQPFVLDVREAWEFESSHHPRAVNVPFYELPDRMGELPDEDIWVYCGTGGRTAVACSLLERAGRSPVMIDDFALPGDTPWDDAAAALTG